ncbi:LacI family DNA-binding transcriptional regulator [Sphingomonas sp. Root241]|uniref:LacI family DNA-binding transcriptional regulator n=1 Tax=Sphingomonas sp. Root241 TaxID=1736501 RepID=UPI0006FE3E80|nr:substrate-binding domain-containing protein [Sphingomonas sp. Root241]KRC80904.1 LacI family transcriptional regulator [Sphingomonas sp. Root241]
MQRKPTSFDIAQLAGVSQPTVSRALRGELGVNPATRLRIESIAKQLNYRVDKAASNLRTRHSQTLALLIFEDPTADDSLINPFFHSMLGSIIRACAEHDHDLLISFQQLSSDWHTDYEDSRKADGIILLGYGDYELYRSRLRALEDAGTHFVRWGSVQSEAYGLTVGCDNHGGGKEATRHLLDLGRRSIAFLGSASSHYPEFHDRYRGHVAALKQAGIIPRPGLQFDAITTEEAGAAAANALIASGEKFDAILAASDLIAIGAMRALQAAGLSVPDDVAVVGFDDIPAASSASPPLTTVMQDPRLAGRKLVETLIGRIREQPVGSALLPTRLVVRRSCGAPEQPIAK